MKKQLVSDQVCDHLNGAEIVKERKKEINIHLQFFPLIKYLKRANGDVLKPDEWIYTVD